MALVAPVNNGTVEISESSQQTEKTTGSSLDKEDFLMLLVAQMKYQDPLEPESNTEYVAELAQFSSLEQMENLNTTANNSSAYTLVGKQVYIEDSSSTTGTSSTAQGMVEYVSIQNGTPYVSVNGQLYAYADVVQVIDDNYLISQYQPSVEQQSITYLHHDPQNVKITGIDLGSNGYQATSMAVVLMAEDGTTTGISTDQLTYKDGTLTINKSAFSDLIAGNYILALAFDDANSTVDYSSVTLTVKGSPETADNNNETSKESSGETSTTSTEASGEITTGTDSTSTSI
jgi:flagellar basal-body rod modification protein FlgD